MTGAITVTNPNDWEDVTVNVADAIGNGGTCNVNAGNPVLVVPKGGSATAHYRCTYASAPTSTEFTNTATVTWSSETYSTPTGTGSGTATGSFTTPTATTDKNITVTDVFNGTPVTLGTLVGAESAPFTVGTYNYAHSVGSTAGTRSEERRVGKECRL